MIPANVIASYTAAGAVLAVGLAAIALRGDWQKARGLDRLTLFGPLFYSAPLAAFGVEHFTLTSAVGSLIPAWIPWHTFWVYFVGACFIAAAFSLVTRIQARLSASLLALTFLLFVVLIDVPAWARNTRDPFALTLTLRQLAFSGGALALGVTLAGPSRERYLDVLATVARYFVTAAVLWYSLQQFLHGDRVPGVPLKPLTPTYVYGHAIWTYVAAAGYAVGGCLLLIGKKTRAAATGVGLTVLLVEVVVYAPIGIVERASLGNGLNYVMDTLMFGGAAFLLAGAMQHERVLVAGGHSIPASGMQLRTETPRPASPR